MVTRRKIDKDAAHFLKLIGEVHGEQIFQSFMEKHTRFIPREFVQNHGIGMSLVLRKFGFGSDYKTDFFYFSKSSDDWNAVFIEIEKPSCKFFKSKSNSFTAEFNNALEQINNWRAWLLDEKNKATFRSNVSAIQMPSHIAHNPIYNKFVLVFGRRSEYENNNVRRGRVAALEREDFKIITFDSLAEGLESKHELTIGSRHNEFIDILSDEIDYPALYSWMDPTQLRVSNTLRDKLLENKNSSFKKIVDGKPVNSLTYAAEKVRVK